MSDILTFLNGKKTYLIAIVAAATAVAPVLGYTIPEWVFEVLAACGLATLRAGVAKAG